MLTTRHSLIRRVRDNRDEVAWREFYDIYKPLLYRYSRQRGLSVADAEEIVGQCLAKLTQVMADFQYQPSRGKFKSWLKQLVNNQISHLRASQRRQGVAPGPDQEIAALPAEQDSWERAWRQEVLSYCVQQIQSEVSGRNYQIFRLSVYECWTPARIAEIFQITPEQVYRAKHKVLDRVRRKYAEYLRDHPD